VPVLLHDAGLAACVPLHDSARAANLSTAALLRVRRGGWQAHADARCPHHGGGLLILDGLLVRRVGHGRHYGAELLAAGDVIRPWQDEEQAGIVTLELRWQACTRLELAVLDTAWLARMAAWPAIGAELLDRALERTQRLAALTALCRERQLEVVLERVLWKLAERFGVVRPTGVHIDLPLTHGILAELVGACRPSVSTAVARLASDGRVRREGRNWVLPVDRVGSPPAPLLATAAA
jgi:hypothetical protein